MQLLEIVLRTIVGIPLFLYLPGMLAERLWLADGVDTHGVERHVARCVVSVLGTGWLALLLAEVGWFSFPLVAGLAGLLCALGVGLLRRRPRPAAPSTAARLGLVADVHGGLATARTLRRSLTFDHLLLAILIVFGGLVARPFEIIRGGLDAGVYANTGIAIARTGGIVQHDALVAEIGRRAAAGDGLAGNIATNTLGTRDGNRNLATRVRAAGFFVNAGELPAGRVVPQFFHLWPTWIAVFVSMLGPTLGLSATGAAGTLGVGLVGLVGRKLGGAAVGLLAALFLALMTPQVWFSRMTTSEALAQALTFAGLWAFMHFAEASGRRERIWWGAIVGGAFGSLALTRIDFFLVVGPVLALLGYVALTRRWHAGYTALAAALGLLLLHTVLHTLLIARAYFVDTGIPTFQKYAIMIYAVWPLLSEQLRAYTIARPRSRIGDWPRLFAELAALAVMLGAALALWRWPRPLLVVERRVVRYRRPLLGTFVVALGLLAGYAYFVRPGIITLDALLHPLRPDNWLRLQGYVGAPIAVPFERYPDKPVVAVGLANMVRLGWYLSPLGVALAIVGSLLLWWRVDRRSWPLLLIATLYALFWITSLQGSTDQTYIYILRRYVPVVYPAFALAMAFALGVLAGRAAAARARLRPLRLGLAGGLAAALVLFFAVTGRTVYAHTEYAGALAQVALIAERIGPDDVVLVRGGGPSYTEVRDTSDLLVAPLTYIYGRNALPVKGGVPGKYPEAFADQVTRWRAEGRKVFVLLSASGGDILFPGFGEQPVATWTLRLTEFQQLRYQKPKLSYVNEVPFTLYELVPGAPVEQSPLGYDSTAAQVRGFYRSEQLRADEPRAAWTDGNAMLRLPASAQGQPLTLTVGGGKRPTALGAARLCVDVAAEPAAYGDSGLASLPWQELQCAELPAQLSDLKLALPQLGGGAALLLRLRSETWVPAENAEPGEPASGDERGLGVRFGGASWASR